MKGRHLTRSAKLNILMAVLMLTVLAILLIITDNSYRSTVYDPYVQKLNYIILPEDELSSRTESIIRRTPVRRNHHAVPEILRPEEAKRNISRMLS